MKENIYMFQQVPPISIWKWTGSGKIVSTRRCHMYGIIDQVHHNGLENMKMETKKKKVIERN